jgi:hypothetical protein
MRETVVSIKLDNLKLDQHSESVAKSDAIKKEKRIRSDSRRLLVKREAQYM